MDKLIKALIPALRKQLRLARRRHRYWENVLKRHWCGEKVRGLGSDPWALDVRRKRAKAEVDQSRNELAEAYYKLESD